MPASYSPKSERISHWLWLQTIRKDEKKGQMLISYRKCFFYSEAGKIFVWCSSIVWESKSNSEKWKGRTPITYLANWIECRCFNHDYVNAKISCEIRMFVAWHWAAKSPMPTTQIYGRQPFFGNTIEKKHTHAHECSLALFAPNRAKTKKAQHQTHLPEHERQWIPFEANDFCFKYDNIWHCFIRSNLIKRLTENLARVMRWTILEIV